MNHFSQFFFLLGLFGLSSFFSATETALFSLTHPELLGFEKSGDEWKRKVSKIMKNPNQVLTSLLTGNNAVNVVTVIFFTRWLGKFEWFISLKSTSQIGALLLDIILVTGTILIFGEIIPKYIALKNTRAWVRLAIHPFYGFHLLLGYTGIRTGLTWIIRQMLNLVRAVFGDRIEYATETEFHTAVHLAEDQGFLGKEESQLINKLLLLKSVPLRNLMVDRTNVVMVEDGQSVKEALKISNQIDLPLIPVYSSKKDQVVGIFDATKAMLYGEWRPIKMYTSPPLFLAEISPAHLVLEFIISENDQIAVVVDEFGSFIGIVSSKTVWDFLMQEISGEEFDMKGVEITEDGWLVDALLKTETVEQLTGVPFEFTEAITLNGCILTQLGRIPKVGEWVVVGGLKFYIQKGKSNRVETLFIPKQGGNI